jgi:hypothetical protein
VFAFAGVPSVNPVTYLARFAVAELKHTFPEHVRRIALIPAGELWDDDALRPCPVRHENSQKPEGFRVCDNRARSFSSQ